MNSRRDIVSLDMYRLNLACTHIILKIEKAIGRGKLGTEDTSNYQVALSYAFTIFNTGVPSPDISYYS